MEYPKIGSIVQSLINKCDTDNVAMTDGDYPVLYNQRQTLRRINHYINNRFLEREGGLFWNISNSRITHFAKLISPDTKDFMPYGIGELNMVQSWILKKKVSKWFDDESFYQILNDLGGGLATYGSAVWKRYKVNGKTKLREVKLENIYFDQVVENIEDADGIVEIHRLNKKELLDKQGVWDDEGIKKVFKKSKDGAIEVWEYYGYYYDDPEVIPEYVHIIGSGYGEDYIKLWEESTDKESCPYEDFHVGRYRGRWMRVGVVERLFPLQERMNQLVNQNAAATEISSLLLLRSENPDMIGNVLEQAINGQIIPDGTLQQIGLSNVGLSQFIQEVQLIEAQADKLCLTPEIVQGEASPANTTFRGIAVANAGAASAFKNDRQNIFEKIADILMVHIFPSVVKGWNKGELIEMTEDDGDVEQYDKAINSQRKIDSLLSGKVITPELEQAILSDTEQNIKGVGRRISVPENFFNFKWGFKIMPTDESVDKSAKNDTYYNALQLISANPALNNIPAFKQYLEDNGISWWKLTPTQMAELQQQAKIPVDMKKPDQLLAQAKPIQ